MSRHNYVQIPSSDAPKGPWHTPRHLQGQTVEESYCDGKGGHDEAGPGDLYQCVEDRSLPPGHPDRVRYYRLAKSKAVRS